MSNKLPDYVASSQPLSTDARVPWYSNIAPTYAGVMLWFVFWQDMSVGSGINSLGGGLSWYQGGTLSQGLGIAILGVVISALLCHFLFYLVPGLLGMRTGLPLYIVGTSTYGVLGGFLMPGFAMGVLQFGWLAVNAYFAGMLLCGPFGYGAGTLPHAIVATVWTVAAAFLGLKGIQYVAKVATFVPLIPLVILIILFFATCGGLGGFSAETLVANSEAGTATAVKIANEKAVKTAQEAAEKSGAAYEAPAVIPMPELKTPLGTLGVIGLICTYIVGFFATAGAAGSDIAMNARNPKDVNKGGLVGIAGVTMLTGILSLLIIAGAHGSGAFTQEATLRATDVMGFAVGAKFGDVLMFLLALAAFPAACFPALIAANSFKATMPKINPFITVGLGTLVAIFLAVTGIAGEAIGVFLIVGASFGPICGAMCADFLLAGRKWAGPRAGFNPAGWISWIVGFVVGASPFIPGCKHLEIYAPPLAAFVVVFVLYIILAKLGLQSKSIEMEGPK